jgi:nucleoside phosphorylase
MPWLKFVGKTGAIRPTEDQDILVSSTDPEQVIEHPNDNKRIPQTPRLFLGPIGSANMLLKNPIKRDELRERDGIIAIEMEGSGVAEAAWSNRANYFIIRGVCDYCDSKKNDVWQEYAASVAAAFLRALLEATPVLLK